MKKILIAGGTGYIGSHIAVILIEKGYKVFIVDNLVNSDIETLDRIEKITGIKPDFENINLADKNQVDRFFKAHNDFDAVIDFAALKAVGESINMSDEYHHNNVDSIKYLLEEMRKYKISNFIYPSSACVYGDPDSLLVNENMKIKKAISPYGETKIIAEKLIKEVCEDNSDFSSIVFRFFNAAGAHDSGLLGELPVGAPNNLIPFVSQVAAGIRDELKIFGNDYDTKDGYPVRDYIHVVDLARAHVMAVEKLLNETQEKNYAIYNLGVGEGYSVKDVLEAFEKVNNIKIKNTVVDRRPGDIAEICADSSLANKELGWKAEKSLEDIVSSAWKWEKNLRDMK
jgi:UDP-glucose 4-epimerase